MDMKVELKKLALGLLQNAYSPYSRIKVSAVVQGGTGHLYTGVNVENASYGLTVCAERNAVYAAIAAGEKTILSMAVATDSPLVKSPCGSCRQVLFEFAPNLSLDFYGPEGFEVRYEVSKLLPEGFGL